MNGRIHRAAGAISVALASLAFSVCAQGSTIRFTNALGTNLWNQGGNWDLGRAPNGTDDVIVGSGFPAATIGASGGYCGTLNASSPIQINGSFTVYGSATMSAGLFMYSIPSSIPYLNNHGTISVSGFCNWFDAYIIQQVGASITLEKGTVTTGYAGTYGHSIWGGTVINKGQATFQSGMQIGSYDPSAGVTVLVNSAEGSMTLENGASIIDASYCNPDCYHSLGAILNYGSWTVNGTCTIEKDVSFYSEGMFTENGGTVTIEQFSNVGTSEKTLWDGTWVMENGGILQTDGREITTIGPDAAVILSGPGASMSGIYRTMTIQGRLAVDAGAQLSLAPYFFGTVYNHGILAVGPGSVVTVYGNVSQAADGTLDIIIADSTPSGRGWLQTYSSSGYRGKLQVDFYDTHLMVPGAEYPVAGLVPDGCCGVDGPFDQVVVYPPSRLPVSAKFEPTFAKLVFGGPGQTHHLQHP